MKKLLLLAGVLASAPTFEVASVKRNRSGDTFTSFGMQPGRLTLINIPARQLIVRAHRPTNGGLNT